VSNSAATPLASPARLLEWPDLLARKRPEPSTTIAYGDEPMQRVDLWLPAGNGPHPIVLMVHGGCWQSDIADRRIMNWVADDLCQRGLAVWNIDYRGVDRGGGYPYTFLDAAAAADALRDHAALHRLDTSRVVAVGHSAGGHLALWLAARRSLPPSSPLYRPDPLPIAKVVSLGGLPDLEEAARPPGSGCGTEVIARLVGAPSPQRPDIFADTSVPRLAPLGVDQILINGAEDGIVPAPYPHAYAALMRAAGDSVDVEIVASCGHIELIAPESMAWAKAAVALGATLGAKAG
jgi:acetyl esterase/lipase